MIFGFYQSRYSIGHGADTQVYGFLKSGMALECSIHVGQVFCKCRFRHMSDTDTTLTLKCSCFIGQLRVISTLGKSHYWGKSCWQEKRKKKLPKLQFFRRYRGYDLGGTSLFWCEFGLWRNDLVLILTWLDFRNYNELWSFFSEPPHIFFVCINTMNFPKK